MTVRTTTLAARKTDKLLFFSSLTQTHTHTQLTLNHLIGLFWPVFVFNFSCSHSQKRQQTGRVAQQASKVADQHPQLFAVIYFVPNSHHRMLRARCCLKPEHIVLSHLRATFRSYFFSSFSHPSQRDSSKNTGRCVQELTCDVASVEQELVDSTAKV